MRLTIHTQHPNYREIRDEAKDFAERWLIDSLSAALMIAMPASSIRIEVGWTWGYDESIEIDGSNDSLVTAQVTTLVALTLRNVLIDWMRYVTRNDAKTPDGHELFGEYRPLSDRRLLEPLI